MTSRLRRAAAVVKGASKSWTAPPYVSPGHFYSPLTAHSDIAHAIASRADDVPGVELRSTEQAALAAELAPMWRSTPQDDRYTDGPGNTMFNLADAAVWSSLMRYLAPRHVLEVGSGYSSAVALDTADRWKLPTRFTFVEPYPDRLLSLLQPSDLSRVTIRCETVQQTPMELFQALDAGDVLFIDSTHVAKAGSDVLRLILRVLPELAPGVLVHFHDVFWPFEYPDHWLHERRDWNEDYFLHAYLAHNSRVEVILFNDWLWQKHGDLVERFLPQAAHVRPGGLWLRICETG